MPTLTVGPTSSYASIALAMIDAGPGDTISLETGYSNETATVTHNNMTVTGDATSTGIVIQIGTTAPAIATFTLAGTAPIDILDSPQGNGLVGNAGNNVITVTDGSDAVNGGLGIDRLVVDYHLATGAVTGDSTSNFTEAGGSRLVTITDGTFENFTVLTGSGADTLTVGNGDNVINAGSGANTITAGNGANTITGGNNADTITAGDGGNHIDAGDGTNIITSGGGNDVILSGTGADTIVAGGGDDLITIRGGADGVDSGAGNDQLTVDYSASITAVTGGVTSGNLGAGYSGHIADLSGNLVDFVATETFSITTGSGNDTITTGDGNDELFGQGGNDVLHGAGGNDSLTGGPGNDTLDGGTGNNTALYLDAPAAVNVSLLLQGSPQDTGSAGLDTLSNIQNLTGSTHDDNLTGDANANVIRGDAGADVINAGGGNDQLHGGAGNDEIHSQTGNDIAYGGDGNDMIWGGLGSDVLDGGGEVVAGDSFLDIGNDTLNGGTPLGTSGTDDTAGYLSAGGGVTVNLAITSAQDTVHAGWDTLSNIDNLIGSIFGDTLNGDSGNNVLSGGQGNDVLRGGQGSDTLYGGSGNDEIHGGAGNDAIIGGAGDDLLWGDGANSISGETDTFYFGTGFGHDTVEDFTATDILAFDPGLGAISHADVVNDVVFSDGAGDTVTVLNHHWADFGVGNIITTPVLVDAHLDVAETGYLVA